jgi:hypothetical protein
MALVNYSHGLQSAPKDQPMRLSLPRFTVRRLMVAVAISALVSLAVSKVCRDYPNTYMRAFILLLAVCAAAFGVGAVRKPWHFLCPILVAWVVMPSVDHPGDPYSMIAGSCIWGWLIGAPIGWISRRISE